MSDSVKEQIEKTLTNSPATDLDRVMTRSCSSDKYDGVEYTIYGQYIEIRPIIDLFAEMEGVGIETISYAHDGDPRVIVFAAPIPEQKHPAFLD